jgi:hypothetical protein
MSNNDQLAVRYTMDEVERMGEALARSGLFGFKRPEEAVALMLVAQSQGRHPASVAEEYDIIQGRPALRSRAALARYQVAGGRIEWLERTDTRVSARFSHPQGGELTVTWNWKRAEDMGLATKDNWKKQPLVMLSWRVVAEGIRATYPACLSGEYIAEEVEDLDPRTERNITPDKPPIVAPVEVEPPAPPADNKISDAQRKRFYAIAKTTGFSDDEIKAKCLAAGFEHSADITRDKYEELCAWAKGPVAK